MEIDKPLPHEPEVEEIVIGSVLLDQESLQQVDFLTPDMFYDHRYRSIFECITALNRRSIPVDMVTVVQELKRTDRLTEVGGAYFISTLTNRIGSTANIETHARLLQEKYLLRELSQLGNRIRTRAHVNDCNPFDLIDTVHRGLIDLQKSYVSGKEPISLADLVRQEEQEYINRADALAKGISPGIDTGLYDLNHLTGGWQNSDLIIIAARPAMGKTAFAMLTAQKAAMTGKAGAVFSLEMSALQLVQRLVIMESEVIPDVYKRSPVTGVIVDQIQGARKRLEKLGIYIDDTSGLSIMELRSKVRKLHQKHGIQWIVVDYLQLMKGERGMRMNREQEISQISQGLKAIAKDFNIPVIALSQLSRDVEKRGGDMRPRLSDLRESGAIEQDADMVIFLHRPEYYGIQTDEAGNSTAGKAEIIVAKYRSGNTGIVDCQWMGQFTKFVDRNRVISQNPQAGITPNVGFQDEIPY